jgi:hypothetical protein
MAPSPEKLENCAKKPRHVSVKVSQYDNSRASNQILIAFKMIQLLSCARKEPSKLSEVINLATCAKDVPGYLTELKNSPTCAREVPSKLTEMTNHPTFNIKMK